MHEKHIWQASGSCPSIKHRDLLRVQIKGQYTVSTIRLGITDLILFRQARDESSGHRGRVLRKWLKTTQNEKRYGGYMNSAAARAKS